MILDTIVRQTRTEIAAQPRDKFYRAIGQPHTSLICEVKIKSPTHPVPFTISPQEVIDDYATANVDAISVVTNRHFFGGSTDLVSQARAAGLPVLRKDFIIDPRQISEVKTDAILLIARIVSLKVLVQLVNICRQLDIEPVVEVNSAADLENALLTTTRVIAVNSRDLQKQTINIPDALALMDSIPTHYKKLFFSGIHTPADIRRVRNVHPDGILIGTSILESNDRQKLIRLFKEEL